MQRCCVKGLHSLVRSQWLASMYTISIILPGQACTQVKSKRQGMQS